MIKKIPYIRQTISKDDISSVSKVLNSTFISRGPINEEFENQIRNYVKSKFCITTNSATSSIYSLQSFKSKKVILFGLRTLCRCKLQYYVEQK